MAKTVYVGMSGGVDSSVAALLLVEQGYHVVGVYMKNWSRDLPGMKCPWAEDLADAKRVAVKLGIDFEVWDFEEAYREKVVEYMLSEFRAGNTPNPDVMCNQEIKFKLFYEKARKAGADFIATGHYARVICGQAECGFLRDGVASARRHGRSAPHSDATLRLRRTVVTSGSPQKAHSCLPHANLLRATDENKDQTYFLYRISEEALAHTLFPIGGMLKPEVKKLAAEHGLHNAYKKESMGVCFVGEVGMKDFLKEYIDVQPGEIREIETEKVLGHHEGAVFYTIGQRHGLYISGGLPYYVVKKDIAKNVVYVSKNLNDENLWADRLFLNDVLIRTNATGSRPSSLAPVVTGLASSIAPVVANGIESAVLARDAIQKEQILVRLRHRAPLIPAAFDGETLYFGSKIKRPASGQSAVIYDGEICLGGGIIA